MSLANEDRAAWATSAHPWPKLHAIGCKTRSPDEHLREAGNGEMRSALEFSAGRS